MKKLLSVCLVLGVFTLTLVGGAHAYGRWGKRRGKKRCARMLMKAPSWKLKKKLGLDDKQVSALKQLRSNFFKQAIPLRSKLKLQKLALRDLMDNKNVDEAKVVAAVKKMNALRGQFKVMRVKMKLKLRTLLTPEQRKKLRKKCRKGRRWGRRGRWGRKGRWGRRHRRGCAHKKGKWGRHGYKGYGHHKYKAPNMGKSTSQPIH